MATKKKAPIKKKKPIVRSVRAAKSVKAVAKKLVAHKKIGLPRRNIKVFALVNGFELIGTVIHSNTQCVYLYRPGALLRMNQTLENGGIQQIYFLIPSYAFAENDMIEVQRATISIVCAPDEGMLKTYNEFIIGEFEAMIEKPKPAEKKVADGQKLSDL